MQPIRLSITSPTIKLSSAPDANLLLKRQASTMLDKFTRLAAAQIEQHDIQLVPAIALLIDQQGVLQLVTPHPQETIIRHWLANNSELALLFKDCELLHELLFSMQNPGSRLADQSRFHIGLTRVGPMAYFETPGNKRLQRLSA